MDFTKIATDLLSQLGYTGMTVGLVLDSFGIPIPSEVLLAVGGALASHGRFNVWIVFILGVVAQLVGGLIGYAIGRYGGHPFLERYGKYIFVSKKDLEKTHLAFEKYGAVLTMTGRCIPLIRGLIAYPAGIAEMRIDLFILYTTIGSAVWTALFVWLGFTLGDNLGAVNEWLHEFSLLVALAIVAAIAWHFRRALRNMTRRKKRISKPEE
jgi:membrane protein DedA with SNARE-associated domain